MRLFLIGLSAVAVIVADFAVRHVSIGSDGTVWLEQIEMRLSPPQSASFSLPPFETLPDRAPDARPLTPPPVPATPAQDNLPRERELWNLDQYAALVDIKHGSV